ncbi:MAG: LytR/AlgR family response regulator transcription factor [Eubacterium ramulus]
MNYVLADDEERALNLLRIMLTRFDGFSKENDHIYTFTQPVEALDFIRRTLVDVVFLDIEMPMLNGITLGKQISEELPAPPGNHLCNGISGIFAGCLGYRCLWLHPETI